MKSKIKNVLFIAIILLINIRCSKDEVSTDDCATQIQVLADILTEKTDALSANPTVANCNAFKVAWLNSYDKLTSCGYGTAELDATKLDVQAMDCSVFGDGGGGGTGNGSAMVWSQIDHTCGNISVTINGTTQLVSSYYSSGAPNCGASGCANFTLSPGSYNVTASCSSKNWNTTITVTEGGCYKLQLTN
jgi:hypothetical protein